MLITLNKQIFLVGKDLMRRLMSSRIPMKRLLLTLPLWLIAFTIFAQTYSYNTGGTRSKNYFEEIPYESINGKMIVKVTLNGSSYNFLFDTGAPVSVSTELGVPETDVAKNTRIHDVNGKSSAIKTVVVPAIKFGNLEFIDIPAVVGIPGFFNCWDVKGIIGSNLLRNSIVQIDDKKHIITLTDQPERLSLSGQASIPLSLDTIQSYPRFEVKLANNTVLTADFDTGDNGLLAISQNVMEQLKNTNAFEQLARGYGASQIGIFGLEKENQRFLLRFPVFTIAGVALTNVTTTTSNGYGARLGSKLATYGLVTIDFINRKFYFKNEAGPIDLAEKQWPFQPGFHNNKLVVGLTWENAKGIAELGEQIVAIDGTSFEKVELCNLLSGSILEGKEKATVTIRSSKGTLRKVELEKLPVD